ncbi:MAG: discoidin domain-containing protein [Pseudoxanthomonas sp.]
MGGDTHTDGLWAGWQGDDLEATIDLQEPQPVRSVSARFLQQSGSWILLPHAVRYYASSNGRDWELLRAWQPKPDASDTRREVRELRYTASKPVTARYLRVQVDQYGALPAGHPGTGSPAYFFVDEIVVE